MLPAVDRKYSSVNKEVYQNTKGKKNKHKLKSKLYKKNTNLSSNKNLVQYSDVSSEELSSSPEAGEIHSDFDEKHCTLHLRHNKIISDKIRITRIISPRHLVAACSPLSNQWELDSIPEDSSMSTNLSANNCLDMTSESTFLKHKKNRKSNKKQKSPSIKKKKKKKDLKHKSNALSNCDKSLVKFSKFSNIELSKINGNFVESVKKYKPSVEKSHTPPLTKSSHIKVSKVEATHKEEVKHIKRLRREERR